MYQRKSIANLLFPVGIFIALLALLFSPLAIRPVQAQTATTWYVTTTGDDSNICSDAISPCLTINGALSLASAEDTIKVAMGTYTSTATEVVLITQNITLSGGWDAGFTTQNGLSIIDGQTTRRGVEIEAIEVVMSHFKIQNGFDGALGGGIFVNDGKLTLNNSIVSNNVSHWMGGGIYVSGILIVNSSTIDNNTAGDGGVGGGGGAGIENSSGSVTVNNSTISNNTIVGGFSGSAIDNSANAVLNNTTVSGNTGSDAIGNVFGNLILNNSTITDNTGGIANNLGTVTLKNSIVANNLTSDGETEFIRDCDNYHGTFISAGHNLIGRNSSCVDTPAMGDILGTSENIIDPVLGPLQDNGGPTFTHALLGGSPALNTGDPASPGSGGTACLATDQRGTDRTAHSPCDIGAYENINPMVASIKRAGSTPINATSVGFTVTFTTTVTGVDETDFTLITTNITDAAVTDVSGSGAVYTVNVNTGSANGTIRLDVVDDDSIIGEDIVPLGGVGTGNGNTTSGETYTIDSTPPTVLSITQVNAAINNFSALGFTVTFSESVTGFDETDLLLTTSGLTDTSITHISGSGTTYTVTASTGSGDGTLRLDVIDDDSIVDTVSNPLGGTGTTNGNFTTGESYTIDKTRPTILSITRANSNPTTAASVDFTVTFSEPVIDLEQDYFTRTVKGLAHTSITGISGSGTTYTITIDTGSGNGTIKINLIENYIKDLANNYLVEDSFTTGQTYTINRPLDNNGPLDITFGFHGVAFDAMTEEGGPISMAILPSGKIVTVGYLRGRYGIHILVKRNNLNGSPDTTFGSGGRVITYISNYASGDAVAIQADGKIIVAAFTDDGTVLIRYNTDGSLDKTFGPNNGMPLGAGKVITQSHGSHSSIVIQPNGQIILAGDTSSDFTLERYNTNGSLDTSFGNNGLVRTDFNGRVDKSKAVLLQPDGKIIIAGNSVEKFALARYNSNGSIDTSFGNQGRVTTTFTATNTLSKIALQPDGKIVAVGYTYTDSRIILLRYNSNGSLDTTFGTNGKVMTKTHNGSSASGLVIQPDGRIIVSGTDYDTHHSFLLVRYKNNGTLDSTFGNNGILVSELCDGVESVGIALQPSGKAIVAGGCGMGDRSGFALARYDIGYSIGTSAAAQDGWLLESAENSNSSNTTNSTDKIFNIGDNEAKKQYLGILSFATGEIIPDNAVITGVTLKIKQQAIAGAGNQVTAFQGFMVDIKNGMFGTANLEISDFAALPSQTYGPFKIAPVNSWYSINLNSSKIYINKLLTNGGLTQIRLRFNLDDNNDAIENYLSLHSGNAASATDRPQLLITYYIP